MDRPTAHRRDPVLVVVGPTAVGKTAVGVEIALRIGGEIVSADSRAFFLGLDVVTDKPSEAERRGIPHHLIDCVSPCDAYDAMVFRRDVERLIPEIRARGRVPVLVGGGTLYLGAILRGVFEGPAKDNALRAVMANREIDRLYDRLASVDPIAAASIHPHDRQRITRALEVYELTGRPISSWQEDAAPLPYAFLVVGLRRDRADHRAAIAARARRMIDRGLVDEVRRLRDDGFGPGCQAFRTIGVPEACAFLDGRASELEMEREIVHRTWDLVRRQTAWFRREKGVSWWSTTGCALGDVADEIVSVWRRFVETNDDRR